MNIKLFGSLRSRLQEMQINRGLAIYKIRTPSVEKAASLRGISPTGEFFFPEIELFHFSELQYNITKHVLYFPHIVLPVAEAKIFKDTYGSKIPILLHTDPVVRFFHFNKGDYVKILRKNNVVAYRIVR